MAADAGRLFAWKAEGAPRPAESRASGTEHRPEAEARASALPSGVRRGLELPAVETAWHLATMAGRLTEVSAGPSGTPLTLIFRLVLEAQRRGEPTAWVGRREACFFPPDVADAGVDLAALPVVWAPDTVRAAGAADLLLRSGAFGLVVVDLGAGARVPLHAQTRLSALAQQHGAALVCLTEKDPGRPSIGGLVSLRAHAARALREADRFRCEIRVVKDKRRGPGWSHAEMCRGPDGLH